MSCTYQNDWMDRPCGLERLHSNHSHDPANPRCGGEGDSHHSYRMLTPTQEDCPHPDQQREYRADAAQTTRCANCGKVWVGNPAFLSKPEPPPIPNDRPAVWDLVLDDMRDRDQSGAAKYGTRLQPHNGRDPLVDAYQEALDLVVYLRQAIYERDSGVTTERFMKACGHFDNQVCSCGTPAPEWDPAAPQRALKEALDSQTVVAPYPADWKYRGGERVPREEP